jgi:hypothetical protein
MPVLIPHAELATRVARFDEAIARRIPRQSEALQLLRVYIGALKNGRFGREGRLTLREHLVDLAALVITPHGALGESNLSAVVGAHRLDVFDHIASHFSDPELSLSKVAQSLRISPRYVQRLLKTSGTSFTAHVTELRLKHAFMLLTAQGLERCLYLRRRIAGRLFRYFALQPAFPFPLRRFAKGRSCEPTNSVLR